MESLSVLDVIDRGIGNSERIPVRVNRRIYMSNYWIGVGVKQSDGFISPINDNLLWLGTGWINRGDWIFAYTGRGEPKINEVPNSQNKIFTIHWNRSQTIFNSLEIHPYLLSGVVYLPPSVGHSQNLGSFLADLPDEA